MKSKPIKLTAAFEGFSLRARPDLPLLYFLGNWRDQVYSQSPFTDEYTFVSADPHGPFPGRQVRMPRACVILLDDGFRPVGDGYVPVSDIVPAVTAALADRFVFTFSGVVPHANLLSGRWVKDCLPFAPPAGEGVIRLDLRAPADFRGGEVFTIVLLGRGGWYSDQSPPASTDAYAEDLASLILALPRYERFGALVVTEYLFPPSEGDPTYEADLIAANIDIDAKIASTLGAYGFSHLRAVTSGLGPIVAKAVEFFQPQE